MSTPFELYVSNIGLVWSGNSFMQAMSAYNKYVNQSKSPNGRASGEDVTLLHNDKIRMEYAGTLSKEEAQ